MKKYTLFSYVFILSLILSGSSGVKSASAANCAPGELFSSVTGQSCGNPHEVVGCQAGFAFSSVTGQSCTSNISGPSNNSSAVAQFNNLFKNSFYIGLRGSSDVVALQQFLKDQGYYFGKIDGSYGRISARAVSDFQSDNNLGATGNGGGNITYPTPIQYPQPPTSCVPAGGTRSAGNDCCTGLILQPTSYSGTIGTCVAPPTSQSPVISGVSGPQTLNVNQTGTWSVSAYDAKGGSGNLSYEVIWGDEAPQLYAAGQNIKLPTQQSATFTHTYSQAGNYTPTFTVRNSAGYLAQTSLSVGVMIDGNPSRQTFSITTSSPLPNAKVGAEYKGYIYTSSGFSSYTWSVISGSLPSGLILTAYGTDCGVLGSGMSNVSNCVAIFGTPTMAGSNTFLLQAKDNSGGYSTATKQFTLMVDGTPTPTYSTYMPGCSSTFGWSSTTGKSCAYLPGCSSASGFSSVDGQACDGTTPTQTQTILSSSLDSSTPPSSTIQAGAVNVSIVSFKLKASGPANVVIGSINLATDSTSCNFSNLKLFSSGVQVGPTITSAESSPNVLCHVDFNNISFVIPKNSERVFTLYLSIPSNAPSSSFAFMVGGMSLPGQFTTTLPTNIVTGNTMTIVNSTIPTQTSLSVTLNPSSSTASQFVPVGNGGANDATKASYNFTSTGGTSTINELRFTFTGTNTVALVRVGNVSAPVVGNVADLTGLNIVVPNGGSGLNVDAFVSYSGVGMNGVPSGSTSSIALTYVKYNSNGTTATVTPYVPAPTMKLVGSKPTFTLSPSNATLTTGMVDVGHVTVTADAKGDVTLNQLPISVSMSNATLASNTAITMQDTNGNYVSAQYTPNTTNGGNSTITFPNGYVISAGSSKTFKIFLQFGYVGIGATTTFSLSTPYLLIWTDTAGNSSVPITTDNDTYFYNYPTNSVSVSGGNTIIPTSTIPSISSFSPASGPAGTQVTITGTGFTAANDYVNFGGYGIQNLTSGNGTSITFTVPPVSAGSTSVYVATLWGQSQPVNFTVTTTAANVAPVSTNATISPKPINSDGASAYTITVTGTDTNGGSDIASQYADINYQGLNAGSYRGYIGWSNQNFPWVSPGVTIACSGGGVASRFNDYGSAYINPPISCSTSVSGNTRTTTFVVSFTSAFTTPTTNNTVSAWANSTANLEDSWRPFDTFDLLVK